MIRLLLFASFVTLLVCCTTAVDVHTSASPTARFDGYRTYVFGPEPGAPPDFAVTQQSVRVEHIVQGIAAGILKSKGYVPATTASPDLTIRVAAGQRQRVIRRPQPARPPWFAEDEEFDYVEGSFVIDAFDGSTGQLVWHGAVRTEIQPGHIDEDRIRRSVNEVLASFPARPVAPSPGVAMPQKP